MAWSNLISNQMVSEIDAQTSPFTLQSGQSHGTTNLCFTKASALAKYQLSATALSGYTNDRLIPKSVWVSGDNEGPSYANAEVHLVSETHNSIRIGWSGWTDNVGIDHYTVVARNYTTQIIEHSSPNLSNTTFEYDSTGLTPNTFYEMVNYAFDAAGNQVGLAINLWTDQTFIIPLAGYFNTQNDACTSGPTTDHNYVYTADSTYAVGSRIYLDSGLNTVATGYSTGYYHNADDGKILTFDASGYVTAINNCVVSYAFNSSTTQDLDQEIACSLAYNITVYSPTATPVVGTVLYTDAAMTTVWSGLSASRWRRFSYNSGQYSMRYGSSILEFGQCP